MAKSTKTAAAPEESALAGSGIVVAANGSEPDKSDEVRPGVFREGAEIPEDRVALFHLDGLTYTAAKKLPPNITFKALRAARENGSEAAALELAAHVIGEETIDVLAEHDELTETEFNQIMDVVQRHTMSVLQSSTGKSRKERRRSSGS